MSEITVCDILKEYGGRFIHENKLKGQAKGIINLLSSCKTSAMGSHYRVCDTCSHTDKVYNSCRNRHCPNCQQKDMKEWLEKRMNELLPVGYYHLVFTIPHLLNNLCQQNKKVMYDILFKAASQTVIELARDVKHLGADTGLITVLHTWQQNLLLHPHLHCIMPAGGLSFDKNNWVHIQDKNGFFISNKIISKMFSGKFINLLKQAYEKGSLVIKGKSTAINGKIAFREFCNTLYKKSWVVNIQKPFANPEKVLEYLSRYVFRIAISDRRIKKVENGKVCFMVKDRITKGNFREVKLEINEFIRRFLLHVLPDRFFKVRYYGILTNSRRKENLAKAKEILSQEATDRKAEDMEDGIQTWQKQETIWKEIMQKIKDHVFPDCPLCKKGKMRFAGIAPEYPLKIPRIE